MIFFSFIFAETDHNTCNVFRFASTNAIVHHTAVELEDNIDPDPGEKENQELTSITDIDNYYFKTKVKPLQVTCRNGKFACQCGFNVIRGHDCQDIVAVHLFRNNSIIQ